MNADLKFKDKSQTYLTYKAGVLMINGILFWSLCDYSWDKEVQWWNVLHFIRLPNINQLSFFEKTRILHFRVKLFRVNVLQNALIPGIQLERYQLLFMHTKLPWYSNFKVTAIYLSARTCNKCHPNFVLHRTTLFKGALNAASSNSGTCPMQVWKFKLQPNKQYKSI